MMTFGLFSFVITHYAFALSLTLAAYGFGARLTRGIAYRDRLEHFVLASLTGLGALATIVFLFGLVDLLQAPVMLFALLVMLASGFPDILQTARAAATAVARARWWQIVLALGVLVAGSPLLLLPLYPSTQWDATSYHLPVAEMYARAHELHFTPYLRSPVFPQLNEMLFSLALLFYDDLAAQLVQMIFLLLSAATLIVWVRRLRPWTVPRLAPDCGPPLFGSAVRL